MAEIAVDVEKKMMMKKGSCADDGFCLLFFLGLVGLVVLGSMLMKEKKKNKKMKKKKKKAAYKRDADARFSDVLEDLFDLVLLDSFLNKEKKKKKKKKKKAACKESEPEEDGGDDSTEADTVSNATLEDFFGLSVMSEEEGEKMKKPGMKDNISSYRSRRGGVSIKEDDEGTTMKVEMPGLGKEDVKVCVVNNALRIEGDDQKETDDDDENENENGKKKKKNKWGMYLPDDEFKCDETKAVMKNGVLTVVVPKKKLEERKDAIHVVVEG